MIGRQIDQIGSTKVMDCMPFPHLEEVLFDPLAVFGDATAFPFWPLLDAFLGEKSLRGKEEFQAWRDESLQLV